MRGSSHFGAALTSRGAFGRIWVVLSHFSRIGREFGGLLRCLHLQPSTVVYIHLQPVTATYSHLQPLTAIYSHLQPLTATYSHLQPLQPYSHFLQPLTVTRHVVQYFRPISSIWLSVA